MKKYRSRKAGERIRQSYFALLQDWGIETQRQTLRSQYGDTHVIVCGRQGAPPLVLFHGVGDDSALMWIYNARELGQHFRLYAVDTIGGPGLSEMGELYTSNFEDELWMDGVLNGLGLERAYMVGTSHGGYLVQMYAIKRPQRVIKAVCLASSVPLSQGESPIKTMMRIFLPEALFPTRKNAIKLLKKLAGVNHPALTGNERIVDHYTCLLKGFNNMAMAHHKIRPFAAQELEPIRDRVLYLAGEEDPFMKLGGRQTIEDARMNAVFFSGVGHGINHEIAREVNERMIGVLTN